MFEQTFVEGSGKTNTSWTVTVSFLTEFGVVGAMILVPLVWTEVLPRMRLVSSLMAPVPAPAPAPPVPVAVTKQPRVVPRVFDQRTLELPREIPRRVSMAAEEITLPAINAGEAIKIPGGALTGTSGISSVGIGTRIPPPPAPSLKENVKPPQERILPVGGKVQSAKLLKHPAPAYPAIAKSARIQGTVVLQAIIGKDGSVQNLKVLSAASPLLTSAAIEAVRQWVYQPTLLNQEPVEVITEITVNFALQ